MKMDITALRFDDVKRIAAKMEKVGFSSRIEKVSDHFVMVFDTRPSPA